MKKHKITATHPAFGVIVFIIEAEDPKAAFQRWKQVVYSSRQWNIKSNVEETN